MAGKEKTTCGGAVGPGREQAECEGLVEEQEAGGQSRSGPQGKQLEQGDVLSPDRVSSPIHFFLPHPTGPAKVSLILGPSQ